MSSLSARVHDKALALNKSVAHCLGVKVQPPTIPDSSSTLAIMPVMCNTEIFYSERLSVFNCALAKGGIADVSDGRVRLVFFGHHWEV